MKQTFQKYSTPIREALCRSHSSHIAAKSAEKKERLLRTWERDGSKIVKTGSAGREQRDYVREGTRKKENVENDKQEALKMLRMINKKNWEC
jgi:hypothetical protein